MFIYSIIKSEGSVSDKIIIALAFVLVAVFSIVIHEVAHGYVAKLNGDLTAKLRGRLTLNPQAHLDIIGIAMMLLVGFGWAKPVPINPNNFTKYKRGMLTVSIAGITANLIIAGVCLLLYFLLYPLILQWIYSSLGGGNALVSVLAEFLYAILILGIRLNFMLAFFNLLPIYPLDGYNIINTLLPHNNGYQRFMIRYGSFILIGLIIIGNIGNVFGIQWLNIFSLFGNLITELIEVISVQSIATFLL
ncbi:MAG: site-2 protease family protein [Clostridia bacterium]|nr:site-2 protease family protein [Clostridia bacterium]